MNIELKKQITKKKWFDKAAFILITSISFFLFALFSMIVLFLLKSSLLILEDYDLWNFLTGISWNPGSKHPQYGIAALIIGTFWVIFFSMLFVIPFGILTSLYLCQFIKTKWQKFFFKLIDLLSGIPSVVFGIFGLYAIGPLLEKIGAKTPNNLMTVSIVLALMTLPTVISLSSKAIKDVPNSFQEASLALGVSKISTTYKIVYKGARLKIIGAVIFGFARVIGETMAVTMIAGNSTQIPILTNGLGEFLFSSVSTLAGTIGIEMAEYTSEIHASALFFLGLILFLIMTLINIMIYLLYERKAENTYLHKDKKYKWKTYNQKLTDQQIKEILHEKLFHKLWLKKIKDCIKLGILIFFSTLTGIFVCWTILHFLWNGIYYFNFANLFKTSGNNGYLSLTLMTLLLVFIAISIATPFGFVMAIYLNEYAKKNKLSQFLKLALSTLNSTPSIIYGIFGISIFINTLGFEFSVLTSGLTLTFLILPMIVRIFEDAFKSVPNSYRTASYALGACKMETIIKIVIPNAFANLIGGIILAMGRIIGESAPVYLTMASMVQFPNKGFLSSGKTLTTHILFTNKEFLGSLNDKMSILYQTAFITLGLIYFLNFLSYKIVHNFNSNSKSTNKNIWKKINGYFQSIQKKCFKIAVWQKKKLMKFSIKKK